jgi:voltage-gated potassium channel Kch
VHEHEYDKDRTRSPAKTARADYEYRMLAPGSVSMSSFLQRPEHPIPSGLTDYKLSPVPPDRAPIPQGDRGPEHGRSNAPRVVLLILPANLAPGSVSMSSFLQRPENPIPSWFSGDAAVAAYQERQRQASAVRPEDQALGDLLDATLERVRAKREAAAASASVAASAGPAVDAQKPETHEAQRAEPSAPVRLPSSVQARMERAFDRRFADVELHPESAEVPAGQQAFTRGRHIHLESGVDPTSSRGEKVLAHELAHVAQQDGSGGRTGSRQELEREAARAATLAMQGQTARIALRAESSTAYAFSEDHDHEHEDDEHERTNPEDAHHADADTHESAKHEGNPATEPGGELSAASVAEVSAVVPPEDTPGAAPGVGGGPAAKPQKEPPNVAAAKPEHGLSQLRGVRPDKLGPVLGEVHTAASADVATARAAQHANPPKQMSTGAAVSAKGATPDGATAKGAAPKHATAKDTAPKDAPPVTAAAPAAKDAADRPVKGEVPGGEATKQATQGAATEQQKTASEVITHVAQTITSWLGSWSSLFGTSDNANAKSPKMSEEESRQMAGSVDKIPTTTAGVSTDTGPAPELAMKGEARTSADRDRASLEAKTASLETQGRADSRAPMGEDHIEATAPPEELTAMSLVAGMPAAAPATAMPTLASAPSEEVGIVAQEQHGAEVDAALAKASADVSVERGKHAEHEAQARAESDAQLRELKTQADTDQAAARDAAHAEVGAARAQWQTEIDQKGADARKQGDKKVAEGMAQVEAEETKANAEAKRHIEEGRQKADQEKQKGEKEAADAKEKAKHKSSGFWGWAASKARAAFDGVKKAVSSAIDACRRAVKAVIEGAKKLAMAAIELARKAINAAIKAIGAALLAISDVLLAAFPELKARFQGAIRKAVDKATAAVNRLADGLKQAVQKALDRLGAVLDQALQLLEKGINAIIDVANAVVQGAIKAAQAVVEMLGTWAKLIKDVVAGPGTWLGKLGSAVVDGIKNHLWSAFKTTVVEWFKAKVFELLGIGGIVLELLLEGGLTREHILEMAMDALLVAIPAALVAILIEKLVSMIVPAAGALMAIIEGLQAAWGTISRIIAAFAAFMAFLLAVKSGGAGPLFAAVLAGAAVVVLDFVANWLLKKLASAARKVGAKLKGLAEKFKAKRKAKKDAKAGNHHDEHEAKKPHEHEEKDKKESDKDKQKRLSDAVRTINPKLAALIARQPSAAQVRAKLASWKIQYHLTELRMEEHGEQVTFTATVNPKEVLKAKAISAAAAVLFRAKQRAQQKVAAEVAAKRSPSDLADEFKTERDRGRPVHLPTAEDQIRFADVLRQGNAGTGNVVVGSGKSAVPTSFTQLGGNAIFVRGLGASQKILSELRAGAARLGMTEQQLAEQIMNYGKTGTIDRRIQGDPKLMSTIGHELFRQHSVEPARISTHLSDRAGALGAASGTGGTVAQLETPADMAPIKGVQQGAVRGHATAEEMLRRQESGEHPLRQGTIRERTGQLVLEASEREASQMDGKLVTDTAALEGALVARIRRDVLGRT